MTRINVISVKDLADQWLIAEYRELPRVLKGNISIKDAPNKYVLGKGHVKWARKYGLYTNNRMKEIIKEMQFRGFRTNFSADLSKYITNDLKNYYVPSLEDLELNKERLVFKYNKKPNFYKWTKRNRPKFLV